MRGIVSSARCEPTRAGGHERNISVYPSRPTRQLCSVNPSRAPLIPGEPSRRTPPSQSRHQNRAPYECDRLGHAGRERGPVAGVYHTVGPGAQPELPGERVEVLQVDDAVVGEVALDPFVAHAE